MKSVLRRLFGILGLGLSWGPVWGAFFAVVVSVVMIFDPQSIDEGEGTLGVSAVGFVVGFVSGLIFGCIIALAENHRKVSELAILRMILWGVIASAVWPLVTPVDDKMAFILMPLGAIWTAASVAMARRSERPGHGLSILGSIGRLLRLPLKAACGSNGLPQV